MGDMRQRRPHSAPYLAEAAHVVPCVIYSRICRTLDAVVTLMMALAMYTAFVIAAWVFAHTLLYDNRGFVRLAIPPAVCVAVITLADAYADPKKRRPLRPLLAPLCGLGIAGITQPLFGQWALPALVLAWGSGMSLLLVSTLRKTFPPIADRAKAANIPAYWQKLEISGPSWNANAVLIPCGVVALILLYLLGR